VDFGDPQNFRRETYEGIVKASACPPKPGNLIVIEQDQD